MASRPPHDSAYSGVCKANTCHSHFTQTAVCIRKIVQIYAGDEISSVSYCGYIGISIIRCHVLLVNFELWADFGQWHSIFHFELPVGIFLWTDFLVVVVTCFSLLK